MTKLLLGLLAVVMGTGCAYTCDEVVEDTSPATAAYVRIHVGPKWGCSAAKVGPRQFVTAHHCLAKGEGYVKEAGVENRTFRKVWCTPLVKVVEAADDAACLAELTSGPDFDSWTPMCSEPTPEHVPAVTARGLNGMRVNTMCVADRPDGNNKLFTYCSDATVFGDSGGGVVVGECVSAVIGGYKEATPFQPARTWIMSLR